MSACDYFGLSALPFEATPDPRFFFPSAGHAEALATLEYMVHARKTCTVLVGASGVGKTLIARLICQRVCQEHGAWWVHGLGQTGETTQVTLYQPGRDAAEPAQRSLAELAMVPLAAADPRVLILDDADGLPAPVWQELLALLTRVGVKTNVVLLGTSRMLEVLALPQMARLRHRVFRTCTLKPLDELQAREYVRHRLTVAGGDPALFSDAALAELPRLTRGVPAIINQVCDNALLEAWGQERRVIEAQDLVAALLLTFGRRLTRARPALLGAAEGRPRSALPSTRVLLPAESSPPAAQAANVALADQVVAARASQREAVRQELAVANASAAEQSRALIPTVTLEREADGHVDSRLADLEGRLARALLNVRQARSVRLGGNVRVAVTTEAGPSALVELSAQPRNAAAAEALAG